MVNMLDLYSDDPSSNPAEALSFSVKFVFERDQNKQKEAGVGPFRDKEVCLRCVYLELSNRKWKHLLNTWSTRFMD